MIAISHIGTLKNAILEVAGQRVEDKQETLDGQIVGILKDLSPDEVSEWEIQIQEIVEKLNKGRPEKYKLTPRYVGQRVKGLSIPKRKSHGVYEARLTKNLLNTLLAQFGFENNPPEGIPRNTSPTSPISSDSINSGSYAGDVRGDIGGHTPERPPQQSELFRRLGLRV
jgi:hypothetical protein